MSQQRGMVRLTFEKWHEHLAELEGLRRENEDLRRRLGDVVWERQVARLLRGQEQLREENKRLRIERDDLQRALRRLETDAQPSHEDDDPAS